MKKQYWIIIVYLLLVVIGIPWYWPEDNQLILLGVPAWVCISVLVSLAASIFTAFLLLRYPWSMEVDPDINNDE